MEDAKCAVLQFRQAVEDFPDSGLISFEEFPQGSCGDASQLLGGFLRSQGLETGFMYQK